MSIEERITALEKQVEQLSDRIIEQNKVLELQATTINTIFKELGLIDRNESSNVGVI
jgi:uncharacterized coiled-coil protein SlyX